MNETDKDPDIWADWLLHKRHADDPAFESLVRADALAYADRVLDLAQIQPGMTLLDVGSGDGVVAFRAIERIGPDLKVVLTDISRELLAKAQAEARRREVQQQCTFWWCAADSLHDIPDASVDVVTTRAVLAYVADKPAALREFMRVLRVGGRISLAEPIFQYAAIETTALRQMVERSDEGSQKELLRLIHRWKASQYPDTLAGIAERPMTNFSERTLWEFVRACGFADMHMELHVDMQPSAVTSWELLLDLSPHPLAPTLGEILAEQFSRQERAILEQALRPTLESSSPMSTNYIAYLSARRCVRQLPSRELPVQHLA